MLEVESMTLDVVLFVTVKERCGCNNTQPTTSIIISSRSAASVTGGAS